MDNVVGYRPTHGWDARVGGHEQKAMIGLMVDGRRVTVGNIFKNAMEHAVRSQPTLELVLTDYVSLHELLTDPNPSLENVDFEVYFLNMHSFNASQFKILPPKVRHRQTTVLVTLARKISTQTPHPPSQ